MVVSIFIIHIFCICTFIYSQKLMCSSKISISKQFPRSLINMGMYAYSRKRSHLEYMFSTEVEEGTTLPLVATSILQINVFCAVQLATYFWHLFAFRWWFCCLSYCCFSVTKTCLTLCDPMNCSTPGLHVPHHLLEFAQIHVHWMCDAIQPSHPLSPSSLSVFNLPVSVVFPISQLFASGGQSIGASPSASVLPKSIQGWFPLRLSNLMTLKHNVFANCVKFLKLWEYQTTLSASWEICM